MLCPMRLPFGLNANGGRQLGISAMSLPVELSTTRIPPGEFAASKRPSIEKATGAEQFGKESVSTQSEGRHTRTLFFPEVASKPPEDKATEFPGFAKVFRRLPVCGL